MIAAIDGAFDLTDSNAASTIFLIPPGFSAFSSQLYAYRMHFAVHAINDLTQAIPFATRYQQHPVVQ